MNILTLSTPIREERKGGGPNGLAANGATGPEAALTLEELADRIRWHKELLQPNPEKRTEAIFALGRALCAAKSKLSHGRFRAWLKDEFGWPERAAQRYMRVARVLGGKSDIVSDLTFTALIALAAKTTTDELRRKILVALDGEEPITSREVLDWIREAHGGMPATSDVDKHARVQVAAEFLREQLPKDAMPMLLALLDGIDAKALLAALRLP